MTTIMIPTSFKSKDDFMAFLLRKEGRSKIFYNYKSQLYTTVNEDNTLTITSDGKAIGSFEFIGEICEEEGSFYLKGYVKKREDIEKRQKFLFVIMTVFALIMMLTFNAIFIFMGALFMIVTIINIRILKNEKPFIKFLEKSIMV